MSETTSHDHRGTTARIRIGRLLGGGGLFAVAAVHALWAAGLTWPAGSKPELARAVTGGEVMPGPAACLAVSALTAGAGAVVGGVGGQGRVARLIRWGAAGALLMRGVGGGVAATRFLAMPAPQQQFVRLDRRFYRPLCLGLGGAILSSISCRSAGAGGRQPGPRKG